MSATSEESSANGTGALVLAALPWACGVIFEQALASNRSDVRTEDDRESERDLPASLKRNPVLYLRMLRIKSENPYWNKDEIIQQAKAEAAMVAAEKYKNAAEAPVWVRMIRNPDGWPAKRLRGAIIRLNPSGRPGERDPRILFAELMRARHLAEDIGFSNGDIEMICDALGMPAGDGEDSSNKGESAAPDADSTKESAKEEDTAPESSPEVHQHTDEIGKEAEQALGEIEEYLQQYSSNGDEPSADEAQEDAPAAHGEPVGDSHPEGETAGEAPDKKSGSSRKKTGQSAPNKKKPGKKPTKGQCVEMLVSLVETHRDEGKKSPSIPEAMDHLRKETGHSYGRSSVARHLQDAKAQAGNSRETSSK